VAHDGLTGGEVGSDSQNNVPELGEHFSSLRQSLDHSIDHIDWATVICRYLKVLLEKMCAICCERLHRPGNSFETLIS
jgi:hypothetical protein